MLAVAVLLTAASTAAAAPNAGKADVLLLDLKPVAVEKSEVTILDGLVAEAVGNTIDRWPAAKRVKLATGNDIRTMVSLEADKAAAGCDDASCMAEIAGAFGARYVVTGTLGKLGDDRVLELWLFDVTAAHTLARGSVTAKTPAEIGRKLDGLAARVLAPLAPAPVVAAAPPPAERGVSPLVVGGGVVAGLAGAAAVGCGAGAVVLDNRLAARSGATPAEKREALSVGPAVVAAAAVSAGITVVGLALAGAGALFGGGA